MLVRSIVCLALAATLSTPRVSSAQRPANESVLVAPVISVGGGDIASLASVAEIVERGVIAALPSAHVIPSKQALQLVDRAGRPLLRSCDGELSCLQALGALGKASVVVSAEVSDLGDAQIVYLRSIDTRAGKELRSVTFELGKGVDARGASKAGATQLLRPDRYVGTLKITTNAVGATVFVDGHRVQYKPGIAFEVFVGSHALRVTHPEHHDYIRFIDVKFEQETAVAAELEPLPSLRRKLAAEGIIGVRDASENIVVIRHPRPWYYRWYSIAGGAAIITATTAIMVGLSPTPIQYDLSRQL